MGPSPKAPFDIDAEQAGSMLAVQPTSRPTTRKSSDRIQRDGFDAGARGECTIDFGMIYEEEALSRCRFSTLTIRETESPRITATPIATMVALR